MLARILEQKHRRVTSPHTIISSTEKKSEVVGTDNSAVVRQFAGILFYMFSLSACPLLRSTGGHDRGIHDSARSNKTLLVDGTQGIPY